LAGQTVEIDDGTGNGLIERVIPAALAAPGITGLPTITGNAVVGETLTMVPAPVTGNPASTPLRQWVIGGDNADGETALTYVVKLADVGLTIRARQIETNSQGTTTALSEPTAAVLHIAPTASGSLADVSIIVGATGTIATAGDFTFAGTRLYSLTTSPTGATINTSTGVIDVSGVAVVSAASIVVRCADASDVSRFAQSAFSIDVSAAAEFSVTQTADNEIELDSATGDVTVTITSPAVYADYDAGNGPGVFTFDSADLAAGPVNLVPPQIEDDGSPAAGETLSITPGLWVYDPDNGGLLAVANQWQSNGVNISGATAATYLLTSAEAGDAVRVRETLTDNGGNRTANSAAVTVAGGAVWAAPTVNSTGDGQATLASGANTSAAPSAPTIDTTGDGEVTLNAA